MLPTGANDHERAQGGTDPEPDADNRGNDHERVGRPRTRRKSFSLLTTSHAHKSKIYKLAKTTFCTGRLSRRFGKKASNTV